MIIRRIFVIALVCLSFAVPALHPQSAVALQSQALVAYGSLAKFATEDSAQAHCRSDVVVWLNTKTGIWHEKGMRWYGRTKQGAYVCRKEAAAAGYRDTENGQ